VSRLFKDTVHIGLHADRVLLARVGGGLSRRLLCRHEEPVASASGAAAAPAILAALEAALQDKRWHNARAQVLLSNALVRYAVIPASDHVFTVADETALAQLRFQQVHGGAEEWEMRLGNMLSGRGQVAAALQRGFLQSLAQTLESARLRSSVIEPFLMRAFNRARRHIAERDFWFAQAEPGLLMLAHVQAGNWISLVAVPLDAPLSRVLPAQMREASLLAGNDGFARHVYLYAPGMDCSGCAAGADFELVDLAGLKAMRAEAADQVLCPTGAAA
jgi:hypothetical protein